MFQEKTIEKIFEELGSSKKGLTGEEADKFRERSYAAHRKALTNGAGVH